MKRVLEPLTRIPGIRLAAVISKDGVLVASYSGDEATNGGGTDEVNSFAALAAGWLGEMHRAVSPLAWDVPRRVVLRATRGALVLHQGPGSLLVVVLEHGISPEDVRVPMEGAVARMHRLLRGLGEAGGTTIRDAERPEPGGIFPTTSHPPTGESQGIVDQRPDQTRGPISEVSGEL
jgi:predicted regulator of Ras-like GTPase activity (Roadblock/LC7/MglB family)